MCLVCALFGPLATTHASAVPAPPTSRRFVIHRASYWVALLVYRYLSNAASFVMCFVVLSRITTLYHSTLLKNTLRSTDSVRQEVPPDLAAASVFLERLQTVHLGRRSSQSRRQDKFLSLCVSLFIMFIIIYIYIYIHISLSLYINIYIL